MKNNRKTLIAILLIVTVLVCMLSLVACGKDKGMGKVTVVIDDNGTYKEYVVDTKDSGSKTILDVLNYLHEKQDMNFAYTGTGDSAYVTEIGNLKPDATKNEFVSVYTSVEKDFAVGYGDEKKYKDTKIFTSGLGVYGMTIEDGMIAYFVLATW